MVDPKAGLTPLSAYGSLDEMMVDGAPIDGGAFEREAFDGAAFAAAPPPQLDALAQLAPYSITTVEEVAAIARLERRNDVDLLGPAGVSPSVRDAVVDAFLASPAGARATEDWDALEDHEFSTGYSVPGHVDGVAGPLDASDDPIQIPPLPPQGCDLRDQGMPPIRDQGNRGTCTAFASLSALEFSRLSGGATTDLSEQYAYWSAVDTGQAGRLSSMMSLLHTGGTCSELAWAYDPDNEGGSPTGAARSEASGYLAGAPFDHSGTGVADVAAALAAGRVVAIGMSVFKSWFESAVVRAYGNITMPLPDEQREEIGHAVALVGHAPSADFAGGGYFIVRNSWGTTNWAAKSNLGAGYGTIPYAYLSHVHSAWTFT